MRETDARSKFSVEGEQAKAARDDIIEPSPRSPPLPDGSDVQGHEAALHRRVQEEGPAGGRRLYESGQIGALLRREGLYSSHLVTWRHARERGELEGLAPRKRGPKAQEPNPLARELAAKERGIAHLKAENAKLQIICEVKKSLTALGVDVADDPRRRREHQGVVVNAVTELAPLVGIVLACT